ncbi:MAG: hypothetical protein H6687_01135 [Bacillales bacterium]|nr:hypothetical protein [Bacillales bacterium]
MDKKTDYIYFLKENSDLLGELKEHITLTYDLFHPIIIVLNYFVEHNMEIEDLSKKDAEDIFSIGYYYLFNNLDTVKNILANNFAMDIEDLVSFDENLYLILRTDETDSITEEKNPILAKILDQLYLMTERRQKVSPSLMENIENEIEDAIKETEEPFTSDYFTDIAEALDLELI